MKKTKAFIALLVVLAALGGLGYVAFYGIGENRDGSIHSIDLGLDLAGGVSITYQAVGDEDPTQTDLEDTRDKLQRRVEAYSTESQVYMEGGNRINIEIPGVTDANRILEELGQPGNLYFLAEKDSEGNEVYAYTLDDDGNLQTTITRPIEELLEDGTVVLLGTDVADAQAASRQSNTGANEFVVELTLTPEGTEKFAEATRKAKAADESIAIYYDGEIVSAPRVEEEITNGRAVIRGDFTADEVRQLATTIRIGGLKVQLEELRSNVVGAQLGIDAINTSIRAAIVGFALVVLFMLAVYMILGLSASLALGFYVVLMIILLDGLEITLTLPGIAGIILSVGMAVDANVLVFARIREELSAGKNVKDAMKQGYSKALSAILDGNITTLIAAAVLGIFGIGTVRGFAYTLALGICVSMFTALVMTRLISRILYNLGLDNEKIYGKNREFKVFPFVERRKTFYIISLAIIGVGIVMMLVNSSSGKGAMNYSLDFVGGTSTTVTFNENMSLEDLDKDVIPKLREVTGVDSIQTQTVTGTNEVIFKTVPLSVETRGDMSEMLQEEYDIAPENVAAETISATISKEMSSAAMRAVLIAMILMLLYIRIRFRDLTFGLSAILTLAHDALVVITCYALTRIEVGSTFIACVLTIIGYSINDTIVTFDRIRENLNAPHGGRSRAQIIDESVTQTLTRSLFTSVTTFLMVLSLYIFGVTDIRNFALPLMAGVICGTYSSIFIASPLWLDLSSKKKKKA